MKNFEEKYVIVDKKDWKDIKEQLEYFKELSKNIYVNIQLERTYHVFYTLGNFTIENQEKISPECMDEFKIKMCELIEQYVKYINEIEDNTQLRNELAEIKVTWWYKLFYKKDKILNKE